ncbi:MAG: hypothetical protein OQK11_01735, partial [Thiovulaceae bacterium]|nr:hypothetical protein [Sulfurimonadaceae bacterium]
PNNEVEFVIAQAQELRNTLNSLSKDTSLSVDNLNRLQMSLDIKQDEVHALLYDANESSTLEVIPIDITTESLTQTIFNTTNAELDEGACTTDNGYNYKVSYGFEAPTSMAEDLINGIAIKTRLELGESVDDAKVTMYYPSLQNTETADMVVVFEEDYYFTFDEAWLDNSNKTIYIMTPKDDRGLYNCYRYELDSSSASNISATKVFRYTEL